MKDDKGKLDGLYKKAEKTRLLERAKAAYEKAKKNLYQ